jgi:glycosyltransferase involved in cell wall biosynthesis
LTKEKVEALKKKLLFVNFHLPYPIEQGIDIRVINLLESFSRRFEVDLVCKVGSKNNLKHVSQVTKYCKRVEAFLAPNRKSTLHRLIYKILFCFSSLFKGTPNILFYNNLSGIKKKILGLIQNNHYDILFFEYWFWDKKVVQAGNGLKVVDTNDVQFQRERQISEKKSRILYHPFKRQKMNQYMEMELEHLNLFDLMIVTNEEDKKTLREHLGTQKEIKVFFTGTDTDYFSPRRIETEDDNLVFYGAMNNLMNIDGILYLSKKIMPFIWDKKKNTKLMVVGSNPPEEIRALASDPRITVTGYVKDVRDYLAMGRVVVLPLRMEYGHRGRIFEVMAMGIPLVVTPQAIKGMEIRNGEGLLIEESPQSFAQAVLTILEDPSYAEELGMRGRKVTLEKFSIEATYNKLADFLFEHANSLR